MDDMDSVKRGNGVACGCPMSAAQKKSKYVHPCCMKAMIDGFRLFDEEMDSAKVI